MRELAIKVYDENLLETFYTAYIDGINRCLDLLWKGKTKADINSTLRAESPISVSHIQTMQEVASHMRQGGIWRYADSPRNLFISLRRNSCRFEFEGGVVAARLSLLRTAPDEAHNRPCPQVITDMVADIPPVYRHVWLWNKAKDQWYLVLE